MFYFDYMYILYLVFVSIFFTWFICLPIFHILSKYIFGKALRFRFAYGILLILNIADATVLSLSFGQISYFILFNVLFALALMLIAGYFILRLMEVKGWKNILLITIVIFLSKYPAIFVLYLVNNLL